MKTSASALTPLPIGASQPLPTAESRLQRNHIHGWLKSESESECYITTDGQSASVSLNKAPVWGLWPDLYYCQTVAGCGCWALSLTRGRVCRLQLLLDLASAITFWVRVLWQSWPHLLSQIRDFPFRRLLRLARLRWRYSIQPPHGSLYDWLNYRWFSLHSLGTNCLKNGASNNSSIAA
jgi:hypothetical protein